MRRLHVKKKSSHAKTQPPLCTNCLPQFSCICSIYQILEICRPLRQSLSFSASISDASRQDFLSSRLQAVALSRPDPPCLLFFNLLHVSLCPIPAHCLSVMPPDCISCKQSHASRTGQIPYRTPLPAQQTPVSRLYAQDPS